MSEIIRITDFNAPELDIYARCKEPQLRHFYEPHEGLFVAETEYVIRRALDDGYLPESLLMEDKHLEPLAGLIDRCGDVPVYAAELGVLNQLTGFPLTRGVLCAMKRRALPSVEDICRDARRIAVLEDVMNPTNIGAIFRSAAALSIDGILLTPACSDPLYRRAARVAMGTVFQIPWTYAEGDYLQQLKSLGFATAAMALEEDSVPVNDPDLLKEEKLAIILGTEGTGLKAETIAGSNYTVMIPMAHGVDSLNVAAASAVAFWAICND